MYFCTLASSSSGNCTAVWHNDTYILIDAGISMTRTEKALRSIGIEAGNVSAVLVTHEHTDHVSGLTRLCRRYGMQVYASGLTALVLRERELCPEKALRPVGEGESFRVGCFKISCFQTSHDTAQSVGYTVEAEGTKMALVTDLGYVSRTVEQAVCGAGAVILEANHDIDMLKSGPYPLYLKKRILGERGHLSNEAAARFAVTLAKSGVKSIVLAHLSRENNDERLALDTVNAALRGEGLKCSACVAPKDAPGRIFEVEACSV